MKRSNTARDMILAKGSSEGTSMSTRGKSSRLHERRKSLPMEEIHKDIQKMNIGIYASKTFSHRTRSNSSKTRYNNKHVM